MSAPVSGPSNGRRFSHLSTTQLSLLERKLKNRSDKTELISRNIMKNDTISGRLQTVQEELEKKQKKDKLSHLLSDRATMEQVRQRNILRGPGNLQGQRDALRFQQTKDHLNTLLERRKSRDDLLRLNVLKPSDTAVASSLAAQQAELARQREIDNLQRKLLNRPTRDELVKQEILKGRGMTVDEEQEEELRSIFSFYCSYGDALNTEMMSAAKWYKLMRECKLIGDNLSYADVDIIFKEVLVGTQAEVRINYDQFRRALGMLSVKLYPDEAPVAAFQKLFLTHIIPYASRAPPDTVADQLIDPDVLLVFDKYRKPLRQIFAFYAGFRVEVRSSPKKDPMGERMASDDVRRANNSISFKQLIQFAKTFRLFPDMLNKAEMSRCFTASSLVNSASDELTYPEWLECLGRMAIVALSKHPYDIKYPTIREKVEELLVRQSFMDVTDPKTLMERLRHERSFC
eukprot:GILI01003664.1.p2 GENE.GILI01003664.1~~GILI01003664.1.p2  ORF type:complete len:459 (-),score=154.54 GILI01003664.1:160-1536(-)